MVKETGREYEGNTKRERQEAKVVSAVLKKPESTTAEKV